AFLTPKSRLPSKRLARQLVKRKWRTADARNRGLLWALTRSSAGLLNDARESDSVAILLARAAASNRRVRRTARPAYSDQESNRPRNSRESPEVPCIPVQSGGAVFGLCEVLLSLNKKFTRPRRPQALSPANIIVPPRVGCNDVVRRPDLTQIG